MIRDEIGPLIDRLAPLNLMGAEIPVLKLDLSWPSVGTLDKILLYLRNKQSLSVEDKQLIDSAAAYVGLIAHHCWSAFPDNPQVELGCSEGGDVELTAKGGKLLPNRDSWKVNLTQWLTALLLEADERTQIFPMHTRSVPTSTNILSNSALGICAAFTPWGVGSWKDRQVEDLGGHFQATETHLSMLCSKYYGEVFPLEREGTLSALYACGLIVPPLEFREPFPAQYGVKAVLAHLKETGASPDATRDLALNLSLFPDDTISTVGLAIACAVCEPPFPRRLLGVIDFRSARMPRLRPAYLLARKILGLADPWADRFADENRESVLALASKEIRLGLIPFVEIAIDDLLEPKLGPLVESLVWDNPVTALEIVQLLRSQGITSPGLNIQEAGMLLRIGEIAAATALLSDVLREAANYSPALLGRAYRLLGHVASYQQELDKAWKFFTQAANRLPGETQFMVDCQQYLAGIAAQKGDYKLAIQCANRGLKADASHVTCRLIKVRMLQELDSDNEAQQELIDTARYAPTDDRVVTELLGFRWLSR